MTEPAMPDPVARATVYMRQARRQFLLAELGTEAAGELTLGEHDLITTTQAEAYTEARVREALEKAAQICWEMQSSPEFGTDDKDHWLAIAERCFRALLPPTE